MAALGDSKEARGKSGPSGRRGREPGAAAQDEATKDSQPGSELLRAFQAYSKQYDEMNDRRERIVKKSRDITIGSKRLIFTLHRIADGFEKSIDDIQREWEVPLQRIREDIMAIKRELRGQGYWRFESAFTPGMQEYVEAVTFLEFLRHEELATLEQLNADLAQAAVDSSDPIIPMESDFAISAKDYLLGVADMTGEAMRLAVNCAARGDLETPRKVLLFLQRVHAHYACLPDNHGIRDMPGKIEVMKQSLKKVEDVCFKTIVRRAEFPGQDIRSIDDVEQMQE